jgi:hypothetical protein
MVLGGRQEASMLMRDSVLPCFTPRTRCSRSTPTGKGSCVRNFNDLFYFAGAVDQGGFTAASKRLNVPKLTLSHRIQMGSSKSAMMRPCSRMRVKPRRPHPPTRTKPSGEIESSIPPNGGWRVVPMFQRIPAKGLTHGGNVSNGFSRNDTGRVCTAGLAA